MQKWPKNHYLWRFLTENLKFRAHRDTFFRICWHISQDFGVEKTNAVVRFELSLSYQKMKKLCEAQKNGTLVLNDHTIWNDQLIINGEQESKKVGINFEVETEVSESCSIVWQGDMFLFGGKYNKRQISIVDECNLKSLGSLPFDMNKGRDWQRISWIMIHVSNQ